MDTKDTSGNNLEKADWYDNPSEDYRDYWKGRDYEDAAERMAIRRLLRGKHFRHAVDIGGGYGRLCVFLEKYADKVTLTDSSKQQIDIAQEYLKDHSEIDRHVMTAQNLHFKDSEIDLVTIVRILHHIPSPETVFREIARVLAPDGYFIMEFANYAHARNRIKYLFKGKKMPLEPVDIRSESTKADDSTPFVNHNPVTVRKQLREAGLEVERILSVSNLRSPTLKKIMPRRVMLAIEGILQPTLARTYFGPSVFFLIRKNS